MFFLKQRNIFPLKLNSHLPIKRNRNMEKWSSYRILLPVNADTWTTFTFAILSASSRSFSHHVRTQKCTWIFRLIFHGPTSPFQYHRRKKCLKKKSENTLCGWSLSPSVTEESCRGKRLSPEDWSMDKTWQRCINLNFPCFLLLCKSTHVLRFLVGRGVLFYFPM